MILLTLKNKALFAILLTFSSATFAVSLKNMTFGSVYIDEVTSIYDGDTFRANIKSWPGIVGHRIGIRIRGIDTPEKRGKCKKEKLLANQAKQITVAMLRGAKSIELKNIGRGKYFRVLADVYTDGKSVAAELMKKGLAVEYHGGTKISWCK